MQFSWHKAGQGFRVVPGRPQSRRRDIVGKAPGSRSTIGNRDFMLVHASKNFRRWNGSRCFNFQMNRSAIQSASNGLTENLCVISEQLLFSTLQNLTVKKATASYRNVPYKHSNDKSRKL